ncbi:MAG: crcB [Clostridiaceae bacterium]|jgi:CrcB protein|nr:crcB [Clostridiaceae bacterium]
MKKYILIGLFGFLGAVSRYLIKSMAIWNVSLIAFSTLTINLTGSFILAFFLTMASFFKKIPRVIVTAVSVGFLGAFTTFSTFCKEAALYILNGSFNISLVYVFLSIILGILVSFSGIYVGEIIINKYIHKHSKEDDDSNYGEEVS